MSSYLFLLPKPGHARWLLASSSTTVTKRTVSTNIRAQSDNDKATIFGGLSAARTATTRKNNATSSLRTFRPRGQVRNMQIQSIPMWVGSSNNYAYLVTDDATKDAVIIDPANPEEVAPVLSDALSSGEINLTAIVNTHHHWDHSGGNKKIIDQFKLSKVIGGEKCEGVTETPQHESSFNIGKGIKVTALHTPCHTQDSICWYLQDGDQRVVFTGDTLFIGGCGKFFEGKPHEMHSALNKVLAALPDDTKVFPGHEYTKSNCKFLNRVAPNDAVKKLENFAENNRETQGKFTIGDEKKHNVFMRVADPEVQKATGKTDPVEVMGALRSMKDNMSSDAPSKL